MSERALQEAVEKAFDEIADECGHMGWSGDCAGSHRCCRACAMRAIEALILQAQREALESVAKELCSYCKRGIPIVLRRDAPFHRARPSEPLDNADDWGWCRMAEPIWSALSRLRSEAGSEGTGSGG